MSDADVLRPRWRARAVPLRLRSDERLARQAARGDTDAFAALYERHHRSLYRYCRSIVGDPDDAADALQSAMVRALAAIGTRDQRAPLRAWLFRIAHNESVTVIRGRRAAEALDPESLIGPDVEADAERRRRLAQLVTDLQGLSERQRGALLMREVSGLGHAEIAAAFEVSEGAVKQTIYEARTALHDFAAGREMACAAVRRQLSDGDGRTARSRRIRAHLRSCEECRRFRAELRARRSELAVVAPLLPAATAAAVLESVIGGGGGGGGLLAGLLGGSGISKTVAVGAATVTVGAGAVTFTAVAPDVQSPIRAAPAAEAAGEPVKRPDAVAVASDDLRAEPAGAPDPASRTEVRRVAADRPGAGADRRGRDDDDREGRRERGDEDRGSPRAGRDHDGRNQDDREGRDDDEADRRGGDDEDDQRGEPPAPIAVEPEDDDEEPEPEPQVPVAEPDLPEPGDDEPDDE